MCLGPFQEQKRPGLRLTVLPDAATNLYFLDRLRAQAPNSHRDPVACQLTVTLVTPLQAPCRI